MMLRYAMMPFHFSCRRSPPTQYTVNGTEHNAAIDVTSLPLDAASVIFRCFDAFFLSIFSPLRFDICHFRHAYFYAIASFAVYDCMLLYRFILPRAILSRLFQNAKDYYRHRCCFIFMPPLRR